LASGRWLRPRSLIHYSKPFELLHGAVFETHTPMETLSGTFLKNAGRFAYNMMHL
jgi:hypothetical protein